MTYVSMNMIDLPDYEEIENERLRDKLNQSGILNAYNSIQPNRSKFVSSIWMALGFVHNISHSIFSGFCSSRWIAFGFSNNQDQLNLSRC